MKGDVILLFRIKEYLSIVFPRRISERDSFVYDLRTASGRRTAMDNDNGFRNRLGLHSCRNVFS